jgi:hypothetical protein
VDYRRKWTQAVLRMNNTHVRKLVCECIATGRWSVIRPKKTWRDQHPWRWNRYGGYILLLSALTLMSSFRLRNICVVYQKRCNTTFLFLISDKTVSRWRASDWYVGIEVRSRAFLKILPWCTTKRSRSRWPCGLRRGSAAARLLGWRVRIPPMAWTSVYCEWCELCR